MLKLFLSEQAEHLMGILYYRILLRIFFRSGSSFSKSSSLNFGDYVDYKDALHKSKHVAILLMVLFCASVNLELLC